MVTTDMSTSGSEPEPKRLLVLGSPRSGSRTLTRMLQKSGVEVAHEMVAKDGTVSSYFAVDDYWYQGPHSSRGRQQRPSAYAFEETWHLWRDPRHTLASMVQKPLSRAWWAWQERHTGIPWDGECLLHQSACFWIDWQELCLEQATTTFQIEHAEELWPKLLGKPCPDIELRGVSGATAYTWEGLEKELGPTLTREVQDMARVLESNSIRP